MDLIFQNLTLKRNNMMMMKISGVTSQVTLRVKLKVNIIKTVQKKEGHLVKVHILQKIELNNKSFSLFYVFI